jgi:L-arabinose isomerase
VESWLTAGAPHHTALTRALSVEHLNDLADMIGVELLTIDADTTVSRLSKEIRWNQAYYRLAQGF